MMKKTLLAMMIAASIGTLSTSLPATADVIVKVAPPPPRHEVVPAPRRGYVWTPGYWEWRRGRYVWVNGVYVKARPGYRYAAPRWVEHEGHYRMEQGRWDRDHDGVPNKYDHAPNNPYRQ